MAVHPDSFLAAQAAATAVVEAGWRHAKAHGWSTSLREAYVLGQLCLAAVRAAAAVAERSGTGSQDHSVEGGAAGEPPSQELQEQQVHNDSRREMGDEAAALAAMRAVDEALILGLPPETAQPFVSLLDPLARHQYAATAGGSLSDTW